MGFPIKNVCNNPGGHGPASWGPGGSSKVCFIDIYVHGNLRKALIAGLIKGNQWLIVPDHKAGYFLGGVALGGGTLGSHDIFPVPGSMPVKWSPSTARFHLDRTMAAVAAGEDDEG